MERIYFYQKKKAGFDMNWNQASNYVFEDDVKAGIYKYKYQVSNMWVRKKSKPYNWTFKGNVIKLLTGLHNVYTDMKFDVVFINLIGLTTK